MQRNKIVRKHYFYKPNIHDHWVRIGKRGTYAFSDLAQDKVFLDKLCIGGHRSIIIASSGAKPPSRRLVFATRRVRARVRSDAARCGRKQNTLDAEIAPLRHR